MLQLSTRPGLQLQLSCIVTSLRVQANRSSIETIVLYVMQVADVWRIERISLLVSTADHFVTLFVLVHLYSTRWNRCKLQNDAEVNFGTFVV